MVAHAASLENRSPHCDDWAAKGECRANAAYMLRQCARSCGAAPDQPPGRPLPRGMPASGSHVEATGREDACSAERARAAEQCGREHEELERWHRAQLEELEREAGGCDSHDWERAEAATERARGAEAQLRQCRAQGAQAAAEAQRRLEQQGQELREELAEAHRADMERAAKRAKREADKREWRQMEAAKAATWRAERAEARLAGIDAGAERRAAERFAAELAEEAAAAEQARRQLEEAHRRLMAEAVERERRLLERLRGAEERLRGAEAALAEAAERERGLRGALEAAAAGPGSGWGQNGTAPLGTCPAATERSAAPFRLPGGRRDDCDGRLAAGNAQAHGAWVAGVAPEKEVFSDLAHPEHALSPQSRRFTSGVEHGHSPEGDLQVTVDQREPAALAADRFRLLDAFQAFQRWSKSFRPLSALQW